MEEVQGVISIHYTDAEINRMIKSIGDEHKTVTHHFNQNEEFFINLEETFTVPHFPIHHDIKQKQPTKEYIGTLRNFLKPLIPMVPQVFKGLTYFFDPGEIHRPCFFQIYRVEDAQFLYLMRLNLINKTFEGETIERGTNDTTPEYRTNRLFLEADLIPLEEVILKEGRVQAFRIKQTISQTWIGETGRGYFVQGIWMDSELTKFFSKLFLPYGKRTYPYYPFECKFKTICHSLIDLSPESRKKHVVNLHRALKFVEPKIEKIQDSLRQDEFDEKLESFQEIKATVPAQWNNIMDSITIKRYLNDQDMKEYMVEV